MAVGGANGDANGTASSGENVGGTWRFAENQWDYVGNAAGNTAPSATQSNWIDLFGWGTSGYNHGANCYQPWSTSGSSSDYYAYGQYTYNLYDQTGQADWGYNAISNGGNTENSGWRTLTNDEWAYVFNNHTIGWSTVAGVGGYVIRPDGVETAVASSYAAEAWATEEAAGSVFLPAAGNRDGTSVSSAGSFGYYWSSSYNDSYYYARNVYFVSGSLSTGSNYRYYGFSVRLVRSAQ